MPPGAIFELKVRQNAFANPTGGAYSAPRPPSWGGEGWEEGKMKESYNLTTEYQYHQYLA